MLGALLTAFGQNSYKKSGLETQSERSLSGIGNQLNTMLGGDLASLRAAYMGAAERGGMPTAGQIGQANTFASQMFAPQRTAMQQAFEDQLIQANRAAAQMGRAGNDPVLRAKLAQEQTRQGSLLEAQQGAFGAQYAQQLPMQQLALMQQGFDTGFNTLTGAGNYFSGILGGERKQSQYRQQNDPNLMAQLGGAINGTIATLGAGMKAASGFGGMDALGGMGGAGGGGGFGGTGFNMGSGSNLPSFWNQAPMGGSSMPSYSAPRNSPTAGFTLTGIAPNRSNPNLGGANFGPRWGAY